MIVVHAKPKIEAWEWRPGMVIPQRVVRGNYWRNDARTLRDTCAQPLFRQVHVQTDSDYLCDYCRRPFSEHAELPDHGPVCPGEFIVYEDNRTFAIPEELFHVQYEEA